MFNFAKQISLDICHLRAITAQNIDQIVVYIWEWRATHIVFWHWEHRKGRSHSILQTLQCRMVRVEGGALSESQNIPQSGKE
jgi:hypothetical protein